MKLSSTRRVAIGVFDCDRSGRPGLVIVSSQIVEERSGASFSLPKAAFAAALPSPREAKPVPGAEDRHGRDAPGAPGASIEE